MTDIAHIRAEIERLVNEIPQDVHGTALLVAMWKKLGVNDTQELANLCRVSRRMVQIAAKHISPAGETDCAEAKPIASKAKQVSPKTKQASPSEMDCAPRACTRARIETPSGLSSLEEIDNTPTPSECAPKRKLGSRLPEDWQLPEDWRQWARINFVAVPAEAIQDQADRFRDFWIAKPGKGGTKLDWFATWRNWTREAFSTAKRTGQPMNWGRNAYDQRQAKGIDWDAVDARVAELNKRAGVYGHA